jgi:hypothetical protein
MGEGRSSFLILTTMRRRRMPYKLTELTRCVQIQFKYLTIPWLIKVGGDKKKATCLFTYVNGYFTLLFVSAL